MKALRSKPSWLVSLAMAGALAACQQMGMDTSSRIDTARDSAAETEPPFGGPANTAYAEALWKALAAAHMVGPRSVRGTPYRGREPHGAVLVTMDRPIRVIGHNGVAIVKKNYVGEGITPETVANDPRSRLASITVMFQREKGYDPDHGNWYWAKYKPDGSLEKNPKGMSLAGRVAKGADQGCIACHRAAPGDDYVFKHDRLKGM